MRCKKHPKYKAVHKPRVECKRCLEMYEANHKRDKYCRHYFLKWHESLQASQCQNPYCGATFWGSRPRQGWDPNSVGRNC